MPSHQTPFGITITSFDDAADWNALPFGLRQTMIRLTGDDPKSPILVMTSFPPDAVLPRHSHGAAFCDAVVQGSMWVEDDETWYPQGAVRMVPAGVVYGPTKSGSEGLTLLEFYASFEGFSASMDFDAMTQEQRDEIAAYASAKASDS